MLTPELKKLIMYLEGEQVRLDKETLLNELRELDDIEFVTESFGLSSKVCKTCGRPLE